MSFPTVILKGKQNVHHAEVKRMTIYQQCKIIEAIDDQDKCFYIFFHKEHFLNYVIPKQMPKRSFVNEAFKKGIIFSATHPLTERVLSSSPFKKQNFNSLFAKLQKQWSLEETALIATYFHPFIKKEKLAHLIQTLFYKERRNGKLLSCYRILHILKDLSPNHPLIETFSGDIQFTKFDGLYKQSNENLLTKDPIYVEKKLFKNNHKDNPFAQLKKLYGQQERFIDLIAIHINRVVHTQSKEDYQTLLSLVEGYNIENRVDILKDLYERGLENESLISDLLHSLIEHEQIEEVLALISKHDLELHPSQSQRLVDIVKAKNLTDGAIPPEGWRILTITLLKAEDPQAEEVLHQAAAALLNDHEIAYLKEWIQSFQDYPGTTATIEKIKEMSKIKEDPNQQHRLGELYYDFNQHKRAIECMSWAMELYGEDPKPVQWLAKLYQETGMEEEHQAYKQLYVDMMKRA